MNRKKLEKINRRLVQLRSNPRGIPSNVLTSIARSLGRTRSDRGKEPTYVNAAHPMLPPLSIPAHTADLKVGTACTILEVLLDDVEELRNELDAEPEQDNG